MISKADPKLEPNIMASSSSEPLTEMLQAWGQGDLASGDRLMAFVRQMLGETGQASKDAS